MVELRESQIDRTMAALSDPTRRHLLRALQRGEQSISDLAKPLPLSFEAVSKHLRVLEEAGLVERRRSGRAYLFTRRNEPLRAVAALVEELSAYWIQSLENLARAVEGEASPPRRKGKSKSKAGGRTRR